MRPKTCFATQTKAQSLAMEIDHASRDQVREVEDFVLNILNKEYMTMMY